jgi:rapamycin-insensitive companion of mTOR
LELAEYKNFVKRVVDYFKPTNGRFARVELTNSKSRFLARTACYLLDFLVDNLDRQHSNESEHILDDFLKDIQDCLASLISSESAHDCLFSPTRVATTGCQYYFLFLGRLSRSDRGRAALDKRSILGHLTELLMLRSDMYLKLVISCLDYSSMEWGSRNLLSKALKVVFFRNIFSKYRFHKFNFKNAFQLISKNIQKFIFSIYICTISYIFINKLF